MSGRSVVVEQEQERKWYAAAAMHGELTFLIEKGDRRPAIWHEDFVPHVMDLLEKLNFCPEDDKIVVAGPLVSMVRVVTSITDTYGTCTFLLFEPRLRGYHALELPEALPCK